MLFQNSKVISSLNELNANKIFTNATITMLVFIVLLQTIQSMVSDREVVVAPPKYSDELIVSGRTANKEYKMQWAWSAAVMVGNINNENADQVLDFFKRMLSPYLMNEYLPKLRTQVQILKARKAESRFVIENGHYDPVNDVAFIWGKKTVRIKGSKKEPTPERWTFEFRIEPNNGAPVVTYYDGYNGLPKYKSDDYQPTYLPQFSQEMEAAFSSTKPDQINQRVLQSNTFSEANSQDEQN